jgi:predicted SAM-dependent methyltransferase
MKIEIGAGKKPRIGYKTCDIRNLPGIDYVCKADELPFDDNSIDEVYSRHVIEHFTLKEFLKVLYEWNRVLKVGGSVYIVCPNLLWHLNQILSGEHSSFFDKNSGRNHRYWGMGSLFGWQQDEFDIHKFGYYYELLRDILLDFGFEKIENLTAGPNSLENAEWHLEIKAIKKQQSSFYKDSFYYTHFDVRH